MLRISYTEIRANGWAVANLINALHNDNRDALAKEIDGIDPTAVAGLIAAGGWPHIYSSMSAVDRIAQGGSLDFRVSVGDAIDEATLDGMLDDVPDLYAAGELLGGLAFLNPAMGIRLFEKHAEQLATMFSPNPLDRFHDLFETFTFLLRAFSLFQVRSRPPTAARRATRAFLRALDTGPLTAAIEQPKDDAQWHNFEMFLVAFANSAPKEWAQVLHVIDLEVLGRKFAEQLPHPGENILFVLYMVAQVRGDDVLPLLERHEDGFGAIHRYLVHTHPELSVRLIERGLPLDLGLYDQRYDSAADLIALVGAQNPQVAREVIVANDEAFCEGIARNFQPPFTDLSKWVTIVDHWAPGHLDETLARLPEGTIAGWTEALRTSKSKKEIGPLIVRAAATGDTQAAAEAAAIMKRFPSLR